MMQIQGKLSHLKKKKKSFPGSPVIKNQRFHSRGHEFTNSIPAQGTKIPECMPGGVTKKKKEFTLSYPFRFLFLCFLLSFSQDDLN